MTLTPVKIVEKSLLRDFVSTSRNAKTEGLVKKSLRVTKLSKVDHTDFKIDFEVLVFFEKGSISTQNVIGA